MYLDTTQAGVSEHLFKVLVLLLKVVEYFRFFSSLISQIVKVIRDVGSVVKSDLLRSFSWLRHFNALIIII
jgi:hypothetical protein